MIYSSSNYIIPTHIEFQSNNTQFEPINQVELISISYNVKSLTFCAALCNRNPSCRTFDYNFQHQCRLLEGYISTGTVQNFPGSVVGAVVYFPTAGLSLFTNYNQTCTDKCDLNHYLVCNNSVQRCQCPSNTFWNGTFCINQLYPPSTCVQSNWCRQDLNLTCNFNTSTCQCAIIGIDHYYWNGTRCVLCNYLTCQTQLHFEINVASGYSWTNFLYTYTAFNTIATLAFGFRNDVFYYWLDDVTVYDTCNTTVNLIQNWNFEQGNVKWNYSNPYNTAYNGAICDLSPYNNPSVQPHSGTWIFYDGAMYAEDFLSQTFLTTVGHNYTISYYMMFEGGTPSEVNVTIWP